MHQKSLGNCRGSRVRGRGLEVERRGSHVEGLKSRVACRGSRVGSPGLINRYFMIAYCCISRAWGKD